ncbi:MAG: DUF1963 domain-containing protein [Chloracidobacterium sp.]|nr:DUF1963 domain-containing protein [Chloracidobacterium sp.]
MTKDELDQKITEHKLEHHREAIEAGIRPCIRLYLAKADEDEMPLGASKMGGRPDLPPSFPWPFETRRPAHDRDKRFNPDGETKPLLPLSFVAQIKLSDVAPLDDEAILPATGILYFFYSAEQEVWGFDPRDHSGFKVQYYDGDETLTRTEFPADLPNLRFRPCGINAVKEINIPSSASDRVDFLTLDPHDVSTDWDAYNELQDEWPVNKMFGYADLIQGEQELECELATNGIYVGDGTGYKDPRRESLESNIANWRLLLQVDSNEEDCNMMWGDLGRIYFWIRKDDLIHKRFDKSWLILQCS